MIRVVMDKFEHVLFMGALVLAALIGPVMRDAGEISVLKAAQAYCTCDAGMPVVMSRMFGTYSVENASLFDSSQQYPAKNKHFGAADHQVINITKFGWNITDD